MFVVRCPACKHTMRYQPVKEGMVSEKKKRCVYCGHTFKIHPSLIDSRIVREEEQRTSSPLFHTPEQARSLEEKAKHK
ncbi:hypothetical protein JXA12_03895 [Candidatus Woesearchaeota archaeon]|nr:hypothetical protein [Candidatus Woesearchaeota archaeon]